MRELLVIGIGPGGVDQVTVQAVEALNRMQVCFLVDKGDAKRGLLDVRDAIRARHIRDQDGYRTVEIPEPDRDRAAADYVGAVGDWHERRAELFEAAIIDELGPDGVGAFLVWGDPALYDSTLRVIDRIQARGKVEFDYTVIPGVTSVQALTAAHRLTLNRIGEAIHITTGRQIATGLPAGLDSVVVMLDAGFSAAALTDPTLEVFWGAYLGTSDQVLISGQLLEVADEIAETKRALRRQHGWIMDTYLLRRPQAESALALSTTAEPDRTRPDE